MSGLAAARALVAGLVREGVHDVVVSPGSRSALLAVAADNDRGMRAFVHLDERSAGFFALGLATAARRPVALVCTSGSAAANYLPAVVEAHERGVPLILLTADRPPELRGWGAGQTIDQIGLYGRHVRWFAELPVAGDVGTGWFERTARRAATVARGPVPGPVHLNCPFREPLHPEAPVEPVATPTRPARRDLGVPVGDVEALASLSTATRGLIAVGPADLTADAARSLRRFAATVGWPVLADIGSGVLPETGDGATVLGALDLLFAGHRPLAEVIVRVGATPTSAALRTWMAAHPPDELVLVDDRGLWADPTSGYTEVMHADVGGLFETVHGRLTPCTDDSWSRDWACASAGVLSAMPVSPSGSAWTEPDVARSVGDAVASLGADAVLWLSSSMPVRDADTFIDVARRHGRVLTNRGANGIDGIVSSALGAAAAGVGPVVALLGDLALLHDLGGLIAGPRLALSSVFVVPNNDGGGIFSHLPIADSLAPDSFDRLFHTPHGQDLAALGCFAGISHTVATGPRELIAAVRAGVDSGGIHVVEVPVDTAAAVERRRTVTAAACAALSALAASS